jgi:hypothetical protein
MSHQSRRTKGILKALATVGLAGSIVVGGALNAQAATAVQRPDWAALFVAQINGDRAMYHHRTLTVSPALTVSAQRWAASMARSNVLEHNPRLASSVTGWRYLGENVGVGYRIGDLKHAFWQSSEHRANMLDTDYTQVGVAVVLINGKVWVAEEFARPLSGATLRAAGATTKAMYAHAALLSRAPTAATRASTVPRPAGVPARPHRPTSPVGVLGRYLTRVVGQVLT